MSGITGIFAFNQIGGFYMMNLAKAIDVMERRGPEGRGSYLGKDLSGIGHRLLKNVPDQQNQRQPYTESGGRYSIVMDGEPDNLQALQETISLEADISTLPLVATVLALFTKSGVKGLSLLQGAFAVAIYDNEEDAFTIARDKHGIKPVLYFHDDDKFVFASEMKSLLAYNIPRSISAGALQDYLQYGYVSAPFTILNNIFKLPSGHYLYVKNKQITPKAYAENDTIDSIYAKTHNLEYLLGKELQTNARASGAYISDTLAEQTAEDLLDHILFRGNLIFKPVDKTSYTEATEDSTRSIDWKKADVKNSGDELLREWNDLKTYLDEPIADSTLISLSLQLQKSKDSSINFLIAAGLHEVLGIRSGIDAENSSIFNRFPWASSMLRWLPGNMGKAAKKMYRISKLPAEQKFRESHQFFKLEDIKNLLSSNLQTATPGASDKLIKTTFQKNHFSKATSQLYLDHLLPNKSMVVLDMVASYNGVRVFNPFFTISIRNYLLQQSVEKLQELVNDYTSNRQNKSNPYLISLNYTHRWLAGPLAQELQILTSQPYLVTQQIFSYEQIEALKEAFKQDPQSTAGTLLWRIYVFQVWWKTYIQRDLS